MNRENIDNYLKELGKSLKKKIKYPEYRLEIVIVGDASIILNHGFRESTMDVDAYYDKLASINECIYEVQEKFDLTDDWINSDFKNTTSFSENIRRYSKFYRNFGRILDVYTIDNEYLICMKLVAFRLDRHDLDDILGIISESTYIITYEMIDKAMHDLYGGWERVTDAAIAFIKEATNVIS